MTLKIIHCADLHIGASFSGLGRKRSEIRKSEVKSAFADIVKYCKNENADALVICGDLFDSPFPSDSDSLFVKNELKSLSPIPVYIVCGNHDFLCTGSIFSNESFFSKNVHIFKAEESCYEIPMTNIVLWGKSYDSASVLPSFSSCELNKDKINILCAHGDMISRSDYNITDKSTIESRGFDYVALGHIHSGDIFYVGNTLCAYSGTPEPHGFDDNGKTGFISLEIKKGAVKANHISLSKRKYIIKELDTSEFYDNSSIISELQKNIDPENLYNINLTGTLRSDSDISLSYIENELSDTAFYVKLCDCTLPFESIYELLKENNLYGKFLQALKQEATDEEEYNLAAKIGLNALYGRETEI